MDNPDLDELRTTFIVCTEAILKALAIHGDNMLSRDRHAKINELIRNLPQP